MTNTTMAAHIRAVNAKHPRALLYPPDGAFVRLAHVWPRLPHAKGDPREATELWLVFDGTECVGAVQVNGDMHAYTCPRFRRRGLMKRALREHILPALAREARVLEVTLLSEEGRALWRSLGGQEQHDAGVLIVRGTLDLVPFKRDAAAVLPRPAWTPDQQTRVLRYMNLASLLVAYTRDVIAVADPDSHLVDHESVERLADDVRFLYCDLARASSQRQRPPRR
jgi:hypothetical protein